jgi:hypothetical protein
MTNDQMVDAYMKASRAQAESEAKWAAWDAQQRRLDAEMDLAMFAAQQRSDRFYHAMLYLGFNPNPTPEVFAAILGVEEPAPNTGTP